MNEGRSRRAADRKKGGQLRSFLRKFGKLFQKKPQNRDELLSVLREAHRRTTLIDTEALSMIEGVLEVSEMQVRDVMIPRTQMAVVNLTDRVEDILPTIVEFAHSRFPVIGDSRDEVVGIMLAKDLLTYFANKDEAFNIREMLRPAVFIPESKRLNVLLKEFRARRNHMAIVVDEYGGVAGLVTIEDVLEQIVGDIEDEHDIDDDLYLVKHSESRYTAKAIMPIEEFNEKLNSDFSSEEFDTIAGLLIHEFGRLPKRGETIDIGKFQFKILRADSRRILLLQVNILDKPASSDEELPADVA